jgi:hypothetical protein
MTTTTPTGPARARLQRPGSVPTRPRRQRRALRGNDRRRCRRGLGLFPPFLCFGARSPLPSLAAVTPRVLALPGAGEARARAQGGLPSRQGGDGVEGARGTDREEGSRRRRRRGRRGRRLFSHLHRRPRRQRRRGRPFLRCRCCSSRGRRPRPLGGGIKAYPRRRQAPTGARAPPAARRRGAAPGEKKNGVEKGGGGGRKKAQVALSLFPPFFFFSLSLFKKKLFNLSSLRPWPPGPPPRSPRPSPASGPRRRPAGPPIWPGGRCRGSAS